MTKTQTKSRRVPLYRRPITIVIAILIIVGIAVAVFFLLRSSDKTDEPVDSNHTTNQPITTGPDNSSSAENPPDKAVQFEGEDPNELEELTGSITRRSVSRGELTVVASIDQYLSAGSSCQLTLKDPSGTEVRKTELMSVTAEATSSVCGPFAVPVSGLSGAYTIDVTITSPDKSGHITAEINI